MAEVFTQYEITKPHPTGGITHRVAFLDDDTLAWWVGQGWTVDRHWPVTRLVKDKDGKLVEDRDD